MIENTPQAEVAVNIAKAAGRCQENSWKRLWKLIAMRIRTVGTSAPMEIIGRKISCPSGAV